MDDATLIARLRELLAKATPEPWVFEERGYYTSLWGPDGKAVIDYDRQDDGIHGSEADEQLIALSRTALPQLLARIEALTAERDAAVAAERERCARLVDTMQSNDYDDDDAEYNYICDRIAAAIRGEG